MHRTTITRGGREFALGVNDFGDSYLISLPNHERIEYSQSLYDFISGAAKAVVSALTEKKPARQCPVEQTAPVQAKEPKKKIGQGVLIGILESMKDLPSQGYNPLALVPKAGAVVRAIQNQENQSITERNEKNDRKYSPIEGKISRARALEDFFDSEISNEEHDSFSAAGQYARKYDLDDEQEAEMIALAARVSKSKSLIRTIKNKFGIIRDKCIAEPKKLYQFIFGEKAPEEFFLARPFYFAIGFNNLPKELFSHYTQGDTACFGSIDDALSYSDDEIMKLQKAPLLRNLAFRTNQKWTLDSTLDLAINRAFNLTDEKSPCIGEHELKHIIDKFVAPIAGYSNLAQGSQEEHEGSMQQLRAELSASLFTSEPGKNPDLGEGFKERAKREYLTEKEKEELEQARQTITSMVKNRLIHPKTLSYIVAAEKTENLFPTLRDLAEHLK